MWQRLWLKLTSVRRFPVFFVALCVLITLIAAIAGEEKAWEYFRFTLNIFMGVVGVSGATVGGEKIMGVIKNGGKRT